MAVYMLGQSGVPFGRAFFNATLDPLLAELANGKSLRVTLHLTDGLTLDLCQIDELADDYLIVRAMKSEEAGEGSACEVTVHLLPYGLIYRVELVPKTEADKRVGFAYQPRPTKRRDRPTQITTRMDRKS